MVSNFNLQESTPRCDHASEAFQKSLDNEIPLLIIDLSFSMYDKLVQLGYPKSFLVFLACFSIKQKLYLDRTIKLSCLASNFNVNLADLVETERRVLLKMKYDCL
eukprot:NODE_34_length_36538_cov_0.612854.p32 type:complete len:105 gc:universal NODE_34_length_36538_cov_0.612854:27569-27255(-)